MKASLILIASNRFTVPDLNEMIARHRAHKLEPQVVVSFVGRVPVGIKADLTVTTPGERMTLAVPRNAAAKATSSEWLIFTDADTYYAKELGDLLELGHDHLRGDRRHDVEDFDKKMGPPYACACTPMIIKRTLFEGVGGYHTGYYGYGHEDSDFEHKLNEKYGKCPTADAGAVHVRRIHDRLEGPDWDRGGNANMMLFKNRLAASVEARIARDRAAYED